MRAQVNITGAIGRGGDCLRVNLWQKHARDLSIIARFKSATQRDSVSGCLLFIRRTVRGYGVFGVGKHQIRAHRFAWMACFGDIPEGIEVCHRCDVPACVNPEHLFLGTHRDNHLDAVRKGRKRAWGLQKLNAAQVFEIRRRVAAGELQYLVAADFGIARNNVSQIVARKTWAHLPDHRSSSSEVQP